MTRRSTLLAFALGLGVAGCTLGPDYTRPEVAVPPEYRGAEAGAPASGAGSFGDLPWWQLFQDPDLQALIRTALAANYDLRIAVSRILEARASLAQARSFEFPTVDGAVAAPYERLTGGEKPAITPYETFSPQGGFSVAWELDLWGKFRRGTEAARAELLAAEDVRRSVVTTLIADVANAYFQLRELDLELEISKRTLVSREQSRDLVQARLEGGVAQLLDLRQAEVLLYTAAKAIPDTERRIEQTENFLSTLLGRNPGPIPRGRPLAQQPSIPAVPPGLPSELLERRPDIRQAEQQLIAANARIGEAKAFLYPQVTITGFGGVGGAVINGGSFGPFGVFSALPTVVLPIFNMGRLRAGVDFADARTQEAALRYQQAFLQGIREVSDGLVEHRKRQEFRIQQELLTRTLEDASQVARMRYEGGVSSYLEVLDTERQLFDAELGLAQAQRDELLAIVQLYRALGGGWQTEPLGPAPATPPQALAVPASVPTQ